MHKHKWGITGEAIALQIGQDEQGGVLKPFLLCGQVLVVWGFLHCKTLSSGARLIHFSFKVSPTVQEKTYFSFLIAPNQPHKKW